MQIMSHVNDCYVIQNEDRGRKKQTCYVKRFEQILPWILHYINFIIIII
jgi:hypothetical protein